MTGGGGGRKGEEEEGGAHLSFQDQDCTGRKLSLYAYCTVPKKNTLECIMTMSWF